MTKLTLKDLAPRAAEVTITHPSHQDFKTTITMVGPESLEFIQVSSDINRDSGGMRLGEMTKQELLEYTARLYAPLIKSWDEDFFGMELSVDNAHSVFADVDNQWIVRQLETAFGDKSLFFGKW